MMKGKIQTVLGLIEPDQLGLTLTHEHLLHNIPKEFFGQKMPTAFSHLKDAPITIENLGWIRQYPYSFYDNSLFTASEVGSAIKEELKFFKSQGGGTIVDNGSIGVRDENHAQGLKELSKETGVNIISGTGFYVESSLPSDVISLSEEDLAKRMKEDLLIGVDGTGVKCGFIGEIGCSWPLTPFEKRSLRASAAVQKATGCSVIIHPGGNNKAPEEIIRIFQESEGDVSRLVMAHMERTFFAAEEMAEFAAMGTFLEFDLFGFEVSHFQFDEEMDMPSDAQRIAFVRALVQEGFGDRILLSQDIHSKHRIMKYGGHGYSHILVNVIPKMLSRGLEEKDIQNFLHNNPKRLLTFV